MHVGKQAKAHEHVSHSDYSPRDQVVESDLSLNKTTGLGGQILDALRAEPPRNIKFRTPSPLLNRLLSRGVTR